MSILGGFKGKVRGEVEAAGELILEMQAQAADRYRRMRANYGTFLDVSQRIRDARRPRLEA